MLLETQTKELAENKKKNDRAAKSIFHRLNPFKAKVENEELIEFTKNFASLAKDDVSILQILDTLTSKTKNKHLKKIIIEARESKNNGGSIYDCFKKHNEVFDNLYCDLIKIGEESGRYYQVLERLSFLLEQKLVTTKELNKTLDYPIRVATLSIFEFLVLMAYVVPHFSKLFDGFYKPKLTIIVLNISFWFQANIFYILASLFSIFSLVYIARRTTTGRYITDYLTLKIPAFGNLIKKNSMIIYTRSLVTLYNSGISFISSMKMCNATLHNLYLKKMFDNVLKDIELGTPITEAFNKVKVLPKESMNIIEIGEESGYIDEMFTKISDDYIKETDIVMKQINNLVKPSYVAIMGVISIIVIIAMCLPLFDMLKTLSQTQ